MIGSNKIIFNTGVLYLKMIITVVISLYSTRLLLEALGIQDFGIFNIVAGVISMLAFINMALSTTTERYLSFSLGLNDNEMLKKTFANSMILHLFIGLFLVVIFETIGYYMLSKLNIPSDRIEASNFLFQIVVITTFISIISSPYNGLANAYENMLFLSLVDISEVVLRLFIAVYLIISEKDKLIIYGLLILILTIFIRILKWAYCNLKYKESKFNYVKDYNKDKLIELSSFAGWNLFGVLSFVTRFQGTAILINLFFGVLVNSAYAIANQVSTQVSFFSQTVIRAIKPQMIKSEGGGDRGKMLKLSIVSSKFSFYLLSFFCIPLLFELPFVLKIWLKVVPEDTIVFCRLIIVLTLLQQLTVGIMDAVQAIGKIKNYQLISSIITLLVLPVSFIFLKLDYPSYSIFVVAIFLEIVSSIFRIYYFNNITDYSIYNYFKNVIFDAISPLIFVIPVLCLVFFNMNESFFRFILILILFVPIFLISVFFIGLNVNEKKIIINIKSELVKKFISIKMIK